MHSKIGKKWEGGWRKYGCTDTPLQPPVSILNTHSCYQLLHRAAGYALNHIGLEDQISRIGKNSLVPRLYFSLLACHLSAETRCISKAIVLVEAWCLTSPEIECVFGGQQGVSQSYRNGVSQMTVGKHRPIPLPDGSCRYVLLQHLSQGSAWKFYFVISPLLMIRKSISLVNFDYIWQDWEPIACTSPAVSHTRPHTHTHAHLPWTLLPQCHKGSPCGQLLSADSTVTYDQPSDACCHLREKITIDSLQKVILI